MALHRRRHTKGEGHFSNIVLLLKMSLFKVQDKTLKNLSLLEILSLGVVSLFSSSGSLWGHLMRYM